MGGLMLPRSRSFRVLIGLAAALIAGNSGKGASSHRLTQTRDTTTTKIWVKVAVRFNPLMREPPHPFQPSPTVTPDQHRQLNDPLKLCEVGKGAQFFGPLHADFERLDALHQPLQRLQP